MVGRSSEIERSAIAALSRDTVVEAYTSWWDVSEAEKLCLEHAVNSGDMVLDVGCGTGRHARWLAKKLGGYLGVDASLPMIEAARRQLPAFEFVACDILEFESVGKSWNTVLLMGNVLDFLHPVERRQALLQKCYDWIKPGGTIVASSHLASAKEEAGYSPEDYHGAELYQYRLSASAMVAEAEELGFEVELFARDHRKIPAYWAYWVGRKPA